MMTLKKSKKQTSIHTLFDDDDEKQWQIIIS